VSSEFDYLPEPQQADISKEDIIDEDMPDYLRAALDYDALDPPGKRYVNVYEVSRHYGGPEEGGWWYDAGEPIASIPCDTQAEADKVKQAYRDRYPGTTNRYSVLGGTDYVVTIEDEFATAWPTERPHYE
jgi:hypothetical protein